MDSALKPQRKIVKEKINKARVAYAKMQLFQTSKHGNLRLFKKCLNYLNHSGVHIRLDSLKTKAFKRNVLHFAALYNQKNMIRFLIEEQQMNSELVDGSGHTPLHLATRKGNFKTVKFIAEKYEADIESINNKGETPFYSACQEGHEKIVEFFMKNYEKTHHADTIKKSPLSIAIENNHQGVVRKLTKHMYCAVCFKKFREININQIIIMPCCQNLLCSQDYSNLDNCPFCRGEIDS
jgi:hypothetical protein